VVGKEWEWRGPTILQTSQRHVWLSLVTFDRNTEGQTKLGERRPGSVYGYPDLSTRPGHSMGDQSHIANNIQGYETTFSAGTKQSLSTAGISSSAGRGPEPGHSEVTPRQEYYPCRLFRMHCSPGLLSSDPLFGRPYASWYTALRRLTPLSKQITLHPICSSQQGITPVTTEACPTRHYARVNVLEPIRKLVRHHPKA
jgi:hypothetical protein